MNGIETSLTQKLEAALASVEDDRPSAIMQLDAFINQVEAMRGGKATDEEANDLIADAQVIIGVIQLPS
jgi:hypothetical protein